MKFVKSGLIFLTLAFFIAACDNGQTPDLTSTGNTANTTANTESAAPDAKPSAAPDELADARRIYTDKCASCHKEDGTGGIVDVEGKKFDAEDFTAEKMKKMSDDKYVRYITNGIPSEGMPAFKDQLTGEEIRDVVRYIRKEIQGME